MRAVVFDGTEARVRDVEVRDPGPNEVRVRVAASGVCHSDLSVVDGTIPFPTPLVMGHEGAGVIEEVGAAVTSVKVGDHVVMSTLGNCGACRYCDAGHPTMCRSTFGQRPQPFTVDGEAAFAFANVSSFSEYTVVKANQCVPIDKGVPLEVASLIGCGVVTGVGAVLNRARVTHGQSAVVIGVGGIGLNVIQGLRLADALPIIAVDTNPAKEELARTFGATHFVDASSVDTAEGVRAICRGGVDFSFECVGHPALIRTAVDLLDWAGTCVILGVPPQGTEAAFNVSSMYLDKTIMGCRYGSARPHRDFKLIVDLYKAGRLKLDELVTRTYKLDEVHTAIDDLHHGDVARGVLSINPS
ncbi:MAG TPA: Zn-dependent alcohol dehydrogenase [Acidimicrobiales bacterium]|nr:Zn-dependent alcohol dehydrogenase [Acidimicrobiales bacterium]